MSRPTDADHPEQMAHDQTCSMWLTGSTSDREKHAYRDGHHAGWNNALKGLEEICAALRAAMAEKRAFAICVEGQNGSMLTLHNCELAAEWTLDALREVRDEIRKTPNARAERGPTA